MTDIGVYAGLFSVSFLAATILPAQSELGLSALILSSEYSIVLLVLFASAGNTIGAVVNWWLGQRVEKFRGRRWFPIKPHQLDKACSWYHRYGRWSLLLSWVPIIGDPLTFAAGVLREPLKSFFLIVAVAKTARYVMVVSLLQVL
ncbi:SNARE associated Golgi protein-like protein [Candidatus Terasakiella magnetica]|uniref:SNARE associated Golgi protein-like protein n=1 Tax=Candidatus Terasakiella magnetica TaxID=1867952 RepID=A0A1C3RHE0_9PROT|nr:YqaA family protein [Candidatus Terasakiella magnetica]SCA56698.1 SNARE associated Golgi protein-like protein [Candidatus Terasakiella magnetica]